ncbi:YqzK family protein [Neobacillus sp. MM2021_6]|uniref:YqzK family protein n=1 Tax=Bacillaceae TaxID=186817 RepID=UPI00140CFFAF|nr:MULTISPECIES: YqzK family protein [Bacillaceae]MBO0960863.1 YqzK family protein [Neobacillus sp. MM2021_6]NHC17013.1 YqzK family protein [Bacillus sp. MM2020_4]WML40438.1 YqzK family protein [Neobacillus sp. OS1-2]
MISFIKMALQTVKVFILFTGCTILFYYGIMWVSEEYQNYHRYDEPEGAALRVSTAVSEKSSSMLDRLMLFYLNGE